MKLENYKEVENYINKMSDYIDNEIVKTLCFLGEKCIIEARDRAQEQSWFDQSGNLRSSIGYVVVVNGNIVNLSDFNQVNQGSIGVSEGSNLAKELANKYNKGFALIVVAGMEYAAYVEALENKVVLASAETLAKTQLPVLIKKLETKFNNGNK